MLEELLATNVFNFFLVFARVGSGIMVMPFFSANYIGMRMRLAMALAVSFAFLHMLAPEMPLLPESAIGLTLLLFGEMIIGVFIGLIPRMAMVAIDLVGFAATSSAAMSNAQTMNPTLGTQDQMMAVFLDLCVLMIILSMNLHYLMLDALLGSYLVFSPGDSFAFQDMTEAIVMGMSQAFTVGFRLASPFIILTILVNVCMGVVTKIMPQLQVLFVIMPAQVYLGISLFMISFASVALWFASYFEDTLMAFAS